MGEVDDIWRAKRVALKAGEVDNGRRALVEAGDACKQREHKSPGHRRSGRWVTLVTALSHIVRSPWSPFFVVAETAVQLLISPHRCVVIDASSFIKG